MKWILHKEIYVYIRENGGWDEWNRIEVEKYSCTDRVEAREEYLLLTSFNSLLFINSKIVCCLKLK